MTPQSILPVIVALVLVATPLPAQTPNFAGSWTLIVDPKAPATGGGGAPNALTIEQDAKAVTVTMESPSGNDLKLVYNLDGTDSKKQMTDADGNPFEIVTRAKWDGPKLVATMTRDANAPATFVYSLDASGHLVLVVTLPAPGGGAPVVHTVSYKTN